MAWKHPNKWAFLKSVNLYFEQHIPWNDAKTNTSLLIGRALCILHMKCAFNMTLNNECGMLLIANEIRNWKLKMALGMFRGFDRVRNLNFKLEFEFYNVRYFLTFRYFFRAFFHFYQLRILCWIVLIGFNTSIAVQMKIKHIQKLGPTIEIQWRVSNDVLIYKF